MKKIISCLMLAITLTITSIGCTPRARLYHSRSTVVRSGWSVRLRDRETGRRRTFFVRARTRRRAIIKARNRAERRWGNRGTIIWVRRR